MKFSHTGITKGQIKAKHEAPGLQNAWGSWVLGLRYSVVLDWGNFPAES